MLFYSSLFRNFSRKTLATSNSNIWNFLFLLMHWKMPLVHFVKQMEWGWTSSYCWSRSGFPRHSGMTSLNYQDCHMCYFWSRVIICSVLIRARSWIRVALKGLIVGARTILNLARYMADKRDWRPQLGSMVFDGILDAGLPLPVLVINIFVENFVTIKSPQCFVAKEFDGDAPTANDPK